MIKDRKENRFVLVTSEGRQIDLWNIKIQESVQDDGRTLKIFININNIEKRCHNCYDFIESDKENYNGLCYNCICGDKN